MKKRACLLFILILTCSFATNLYAEALSSGSTYTIKSAMKHNYAIDIYWGAQKSLRGRKVQLYNYLCRDNQQFVVSSVGIGYYLDVDRGECRDEANIQNSRKTDRNNQRWLLTLVGNTTTQIGNSTKQKILRKKNETAKNNTKASFVFVEMGLEALKREIGRAVQGDEQSKLRVINLWKQQLSKIDMEKYNSKEARSRIQNLIDQKKIPAYILKRGVYKYTEGHNAAYANEENVFMRSQPKISLF